MKQNSNLSRNRVMEPETISKNEVSPKNHRSRGNFLMIVCFALAVGFIGCDKDKESGRRNGIISRFDLPHHRAYRSVHGGSLI